MDVRLAKIATALAGAMLLAGCAGIREHRGSVIDTELVSTVQVGVDNKDSVQRVLGRPTFTGQFGDSDWYYVSRDTRRTAFANGHLTDQTLLHVRFDQAGNVASIDQTGKEMVAKIDPVDEITPTAGRKRGFLDEFFGNIGSVSSAGGMAPPAGDQ